jgi:hypothetical protein
MPSINKRTGALKGGSSKTMGKSSVKSKGAYAGNIVNAAKNSLMPGPIGGGNVVGTSLKKWGTG